MSATTTIAAPATKADKLNALYKECGLVPEDVHKHQHYTIITRTGIEKIQAHYKIRVKYKALRLEPKYAVIKAVAKMDDVEVETYGSAVPDNCRASYFAEMAEKRALSRAVLKLTGLYQHGFFGEDESEDFKATPSATPSAAPAPTLAAPMPLAPESRRLIERLVTHELINHDEREKTLANLDALNHETGKQTITVLTKRIQDRGGEV